MKYGKLIVMRKGLRNATALSLLLALTAGSLSAQEDTTAQNFYEGLSLKELLDVKIVSVSKNSELLFDAPLSASVVTKEEISLSGATSIMEALRLVPGMIIREQTNGNYDIYLRGMDNVPPNSSFDGNSTTTLVMLNNRPIYNYLKGGTFWETLPVDINDVEKIEVVRGPAAALYGPNAVSGVINIITREATQIGLYAVANSRQGTNHTVINNATIGYRFNDKWSVLASGNYQHRDRSETSYFEVFRNTYLNDSLSMFNFLGKRIDNIQNIFPNRELAMKKYAGNFSAQFNASEDVNISLMAGAQHSVVQKVSTENSITPLSTVASDSRYADLRARVNRLTAQFSYNEGTQVPDHQPGNIYDFATFDMGAEYSANWKKFSLKPGVAYRSAVYDDLDYSDPGTLSGLFNARALVTTLSGSLRSEYTLLHDKIRLVAGMMASKFNHPDSTYLSFELAATWKPHPKHLFRAVFSQAPRSSAAYDLHANKNLSVDQVGHQLYLVSFLAPEQNMKLLTAEMFEVGYRASLSNRAALDVELFTMGAKDFGMILPNDYHVTLQGNDTMLHMPLRFTNLPVAFRQFGGTLSIDYRSPKLQIKPFITVQHSLIRHYSPYMSTPGSLPYAANPNPATHHIRSGIGSKQKVQSTPTVFGGGYVNFRPSGDWNFNLNAYYYSSQTYKHASNSAFNDGVRGIDNIRGKLLLNATVSYEVTDALHFSLSARNALNDQSREFFYTDRTPFMLLGGIHFDLNR